MHAARTPIRDATGHPTKRRGGERPADAHQVYAAWAIVASRPGEQRAGAGGIDDSISTACLLHQHGLLPRTIPVHSINLAERLLAAGVRCGLNTALEIIDLIGGSPPRDQERWVQELLARPELRADNLRGICPTASLPLFREYSSITLAIGSRPDSDQVGRRGGTAVRASASLTA